MRDLADEPPRGSAASTSPAKPAAAPTRMVVAIFQRPNAAWFFKVTGAPGEVKETEPAWQAFFDSIRFEKKSGDEVPAWELPDGWSLGGKAQMVFAILNMPDSELQVRISRLGGQQDLLSNVNRWRGQLDLSPASASSLDDNLAEKKGQQSNYRLFDQKGVSAGQSMGGGPFMQKRKNTVVPEDDGPPTREPGLPAERTEVDPPDQLKNDFEANPKFTLDPPEGYSPGKTSAMVVARFTKETADGTAQISVVPLTATNNWIDNVNFWRQSLGLEPSEAAEIESATESMSISGIDGQRIELMADDFADEVTDESRSLIGVMVKHEDSAWFFKMMGDHEMVKADQATFDAFLKSFKFTDAP